MTKEQLKQEAEESWQNDSTVSGASMPDKIYVAGYLVGAEPREKCIAELEAQLKIISFKIINCIKSHLCKQDEDYDKPIISPKFLSDTLDQMAIDGFEGI